MAHLSLVRFGNCLTASVAVLVGGYVVLLPYDSTALVLAAVTAFCSCAFGNILNDLIDQKIDRINHPDRVLVNGRMSSRAAVVSMLTYGVLGLTAAALVSWSLLVLVSVALLLLVWYNVQLKQWPLAGNVAVSLLSALTFVAGGLAVDYDLTWRLPGPLIPAVFAFLFHFVRELIKDVSDIEGDRRGGLVTLPILVGIRPTLSLALLAFLLLVAATLVPVYYDWFGRVYELITVYFIDLPLLFLLILIWGNPTPRLLRWGASALKIGMILGLVALVLSAPTM